MKTKKTDNWTAWTKILSEITFLNSNWELSWVPQDHEKLTSGTFYAVLTHCFCVPAGVSELFSYVWFLSVDRSCLFLAARPWDLRPQWCGMLWNLYRKLILYFCVCYFTCPGGWGAEGGDGNLKKITSRQKRKSQKLRNRSRWGKAKPHFWTHTERETKMRRGREKRERERRGDFWVLIYHFEP